jgi:pyridoxal 5'-phosphate synthase pdxS subunit
MIRTKGEAGSGDIVEAMRHRRMMTRGVQIVGDMETHELDSLAEKFAERYDPLNEAVLDDLGVDDAYLSEAYTGYDYDVLVSNIRDVLADVQKLGRLPVVDFTAGGIATPADAALMMQMGSDGVFVGSGIFKSGNPEKRAKAIVEATTHYKDPAIVGEVSKNLGEAMVGRNLDELTVRLAERGI